MSIDSDKIKSLEERLLNLQIQHERNNREIRLLQSEITNLKSEGTEAAAQETQWTEAVKEDQKPVESIPSKEPDTKAPVKPEKARDAGQFKVPPKSKNRSLTWDLEKFIGENLINKIGILLTVIGVVVGAKYAIDHEMINPATRIILGYITGFILLGISLKLKKNYLNFSSVLLGGSLAILYFISYAAYSFYAFYSLGLTSILMFVVTVGAVFAALHLNRSVIAHFGLVGAYAIPFLVSTESGNYEVLFAYMAIINLGILFISIRRKWQSLYYSAFVFTWLIFGVWAGMDYENSSQNSAHFFLALFFLIFVAARLGYHLIKKLPLKELDLPALFSNNLVYYGLSYYLLQEADQMDQYLGLFSFSLAFFNGLLCYAVYRWAPENRKLYWVQMALAILFFSLAIPAQFDGNTITLIWSLEALIFFWLALEKELKSFQYFAYPLFLLGFFSLMSDWNEDYFQISREIKRSRSSFFNLPFLYCLITVGFGYAILWMQNRSRGTQVKAEDTTVGFDRIIAVISLFSTWFIFRQEIHFYWHKLYLLSEYEIEMTNYSYERYNRNYDYLGWTWEFLFGILFLLILQIVNQWRLHSKLLANALKYLNWLAIPAFLIAGIYFLAEIADHYSTALEDLHQKASLSQMLLRYPAFLALGLLLFFSWRSSQKSYSAYLKVNRLEIFIHITVLWMLSAELLHIFKLAHFDGFNQLLLSILWALYSFFLIAQGMSKNKKHLRITAMVFFGLILLKLILWDLSSLSSLSKTAVLMVVGALLLLSSFWYNRQKKVIKETRDLEDS